MEVQASDVIEVYKKRLTEANHTIAILEAQIMQLQRQEAHDDQPRPGSERH